MNNEMLGFIELERFLASITDKPHTVANAERDHLALTRYDFIKYCFNMSDFSIDDFERCSIIHVKEQTRSFAPSKKTVLYFVLDEKGFFVEDYSNAKEIIRDFTRTELDGQEALLDGMSGHYTYRVSTNRTEYMDAINFSDEKTKTHSQPYKSFCTLC